MSPELNVELEQLRIAEQVARMGSYVWDLGTDAVTWSSGLRQLLDVPDGMTASIDFWMSMVPPEYLELAMSRKNDNAADRKPGQLEYPMVTLGEREIWIKLRSRPVELVGRPTVIGVAIDITQQVHVRQEMADLNRMLVEQLQTSADLVRLLEQQRVFAHQQPPIVS